MRLPEASVKLMDGAAQIVREHSGPNNKIFAYPEFVLFYAVTHRRFLTRSGSHNIDVVKDAFSIDEANRLLASPPAVLIYSRPEESNLEGDEILARWKRSGQRDLIAAVEKLIPGYDLAVVYDMHPNRTPVKIYTRK